MSMARTVQRWTNERMNRALRALGSSPVFSRAWEEQLDVRVRREIITRFGSFTLPARHIEAMPAHAWRWMLRPAMGVAGVGAVAVGALTAAIALRHDAAPAANTVLPPVAMVNVVAPAPVAPGSGTALSVFSAQTASAPSPRAPSSTRRAPTRRGAPLTPAAGVFTEWGKGVFSDEVSSAPKQDAGIAFSG